MINSSLPAVDGSLNREIKFDSNQTDGASQSGAKPKEPLLFKNNENIKKKLHVFMQTFKVLPILHYAEIIGENPGFYRSATASCCCCYFMQITI